MLISEFLIALGSVRGLTMLLIFKCLKVEERLDPEITNDSNRFTRLLKHKAVVDTQGFLQLG
jgi:hypothetical protein